MMFSQILRTLAAKVLMGSESWGEKMGLTCCIPRDVDLFTPYFSSISIYMSISTALSFLMERNAL